MPNTAAWWPPIRSETLFWVCLCAQADSLPDSSRTHVQHSGRLAKHVARAVRPTCDPLAGGGGVVRHAAGGQGLACGC